MGSFWRKSRTKAAFSLLQLSDFQGSLARKLRFTSSTFSFWRKSCTKAWLSHLQLLDFEGSLARKLGFHIFNFQLLKEVLHESLAFTSSTLDFEGRLARKLGFHIFNFQILKEVLYESLVFTSLTFRFWWESRRKASISHLQLSDFIGCLAQLLQWAVFGGSLARKLPFHFFSFQTFREVSHESFVSTSSMFIFWRKSCTKAWLSHLQLLDFEGSLARKLRFTSSTFSFWRKSCTKAWLSHLQLLDFEGSLARKLGFHIFNFQILTGVSQESFDFTSAAFRFYRMSCAAAAMGSFWRKSRTKAAFSLLQLSDFQGSLARKLRFHIFHVQLLKEVLHESLAFTSSTLRLWGKSCTKAWLSHLQLLDFEGSLARKLGFHTVHFLHLARKASFCCFALLMCAQY